MDLKLKLIQINMYFVRDWWPCKEQAIILAYYLLLKHKQTAQKRNECLNDFCCLRLGMICITWFSSWYKVIPILCKKSLLLKTKYRLNQVCFKITSPCANTELTLNNSNCAAKKPTIQCSLAWKVKLCQNTSLRIIKEVEKLKICKKKKLFPFFSPIVLKYYFSFQKTCSPKSKRLPSAVLGCITCRSIIYVKPILLS